MKVQYFQYQDVEQVTRTGYVEFFGDAPKGRSLKDWSGVVHAEGKRIPVVHCKEGLSAFVAKVTDTRRRIRWVN